MMHIIIVQRYSAESISVDMKRTKSQASQRSVNSLFTTVDTAALDRC